MPSSAIRLVAIACAAALLCGAVGTLLELHRFGLTSASTAAHVEESVREWFANRAQHVQSLADRTARESSTAIVAALADSDEKPALFDQLKKLADDAGPGSVSATVYVPTGVPNQYRVLAWSDGPAENIGPDRLAGPPALFLARGTLGLRLIYSQPIESAGRRVAVVSAETVLAPAVGVGPIADVYELATGFGPARAAITFAGATADERDPSRFVIAPQGGGSALDIRFDPERLRAERLAFRNRVAAVSAIPLVIAMLLLTGRAVRRRTESRDIPTFLLWSGVAVLIIAAAGAALYALVPIIGVDEAWRPAVIALATLAAVAVLPMSWWWRRPHRLRLTQQPVRFLVEQIASGAAVTLLLWLAARLLHDRINTATLAQWLLPLFPIELEAPAYVGGLILYEIAIYWAIAMLLAVMAGRWRLGAGTPRPSIVGVACWLAPLGALLATRWSPFPLPSAGLMIAATSAAIFALYAARFRHQYRHATQALRLVLLFLALFGPVIVLYPTAWFYAEAVARSVIAREYAPATTGRPQQILRELKQAQNDIDHIPTAQLLELVAGAPATDGPIPTFGAFGVWNQTSLAQTRATSAIELYGANGKLVSRFALNVPQYGAVAETSPASEAASCKWNVTGLAIPFGAEERDMVLADRKICDAAGVSQGAISVYVINDYQSLPFVSSANPYSDVLRGPQATTRRAPLSGLQVVVYGWSLSPVFTSTNVAWPITPDLFARFYRSRDPFWAELRSEDRAYNVYFSNDSRFIYALGYPTTTIFQHFTRLAEMGTLTAVIFVLLLLGAALYAPFARRAAPPLARLLDEIRTSFYRKLFLFFVLAAIAPVMLFAVAFRAYMTDKFRTDVENEAAGVVTVARRVLEQSVAFEQDPGRLRTSLNDDVMVWIGQVLHQDVNLFEGPELVATSQRDLFASGLLPTRTPAAIYRAIAVNRLPTAVAEDRLGTFQYLVAAARVPVARPVAGQEVVLSVPLALRQREIEREIDDLNRGVLVGAVFIILFAAGLGASVARRVSDPVARLSRATRQIAAGKLDVRIVADTADELRRLIDDFNSMAATLSAQRAELARTNQLKAWAEMARQVAHEIKNPLTPIQLATEHLQHVHEDRKRPLSPVFDQCVTTILRQVRLLRQIAGEFANFAGETTPRFAAVRLAALLDDVLQPYASSAGLRMTIERRLPADLPDVWIDRTLIARALTNLIENALQAMPEGGRLTVSASADETVARVTVADTGVGMDREAAERAFEPYFSTKTAGSGLGLANAKRNVELCGGTIALESAPGRGTTATVTLPVTPRRAERETASTPSR